MRDVKRLEGFYKQLKEYHKQVPDLRFGQLIMNFQSWYKDKYDTDIWGLEENGFLDMFNEFMDWMNNCELVMKYPFIKIDKNRTWTFLDLIPKGWTRAFGKQFCEELNQAIIADGLKPEEFEIVEMKEKYGMLNIYYNPRGKNIDEVIKKFEKISEYICVDCGKKAKYYTTGWVSPFCEECIEKEEYRNYKGNKEKGIEKIEEIKEKDVEKYCKK